LRVEREGGGVVCERCEVADTMRTRMRGLLGRKELPVGAGLWIRPASSIHMFFRVVGIAESLRPWRVAWHRGAHIVLELPAGEAERRSLRAGERLALRGEESDERAEG
jgi:uncharacterized protein